MKRNTDIILDMVHKYCNRKKVIVYIAPKWFETVINKMVARTDIILTREEVKSMINFLMVEYDLTF